jgi:hypothetical protein
MPILQKCELKKFLAALAVDRNTTKVISADGECNIIRYSLGDFRTDIALNYHGLWTDGLKLTRLKDRVEEHRRNKIKFAPCVVFT